MTRGARIFGLAAALCAAAWLVFRSSTGSHVPEPVAKAEAPEEAPRVPPRPPPAVDEDDKMAPAEDANALREQRLARAKHTLDSYLEATRYPPNSRPMSEHPDLRDPHHVEPVTHPLARKDRVATDARVVLRQDRFFLVGDETAVLEIACSNSDGPIPCNVVSSKAIVPPSETQAAPLPEVAVPFQSGAQGGAIARLQPSSLGFGQYHGTVRVAVDLRIGSESGGASFDVQYTPSAPAKFTGKVREELASGSLDLFVELEVTKPGRYVLSGRVDDRDGRTFGYVTFNEELAAGRQEARFRVFGKLVRDENAPSPFRLRDVEGFLLRENAHPDRELMSMMSGLVFTTRPYESRQFSDAVWDSEDKRRHVTEFQKDVDELSR